MYEHEVNFSSKKHILLLYNKKILISKSSSLHARPYHSHNIVKLIKIYKFIHIYVCIRDAHIYVYIDREWEIEEKQKQVFHWRTEISGQTTMRSGDKLI